ncbi:MAG: DNA/RNA nuclease SfsA, partial [Ruminococcaceae bacterium]|nr:DNA/RNA nuclease SfsA [Oscillospiraceae bacterium]
KKGGLFRDVTMVKPEAVYGDSRFDFYVEHGGTSAFVEVKGVTLEEDGVLLFPDAPTVRGVKHINELINARKNGYEAYIIFVVQTEKAKYFTPNMKTHKEFGEALELAYKNGVKILCYSCRTGTGYLEIGRPVPVKLSI